MNKIYKVIWSKAKHTYVVTSEIAKSHSKAESTGKGLKKLAIVLLAVTALLGSGSYTYAADSTQVGAAELKVFGNKYGVITGTNEAAKAINEAVQQVKANTTQIANNSSTLGTVQESMTALEKKVNDMGSTGKADLEAEATAREAADTAINNKLAQDKTDTALHVTKDGNLIVGTKENQTVRDVKIRGQLASGSVSTGNITSTGDVSVAGKVEAGAVYDDTTKTGNYVVQTNSVGANLSALDTQVKSNADAVTAEASAREAADKDLSDQIATKANAADVYTKTETDSKIDAAKKEANTYTYRKVAAEEAARKAADNELNERITNEANAIHETTNQLQNDLNTETQARQAADTELNERITNEANAIHDEIKAGDTALDNRITAVKESLQADASVQDGAVVKAGSTIGKNVQDLDTALAKETAARIGADKAQDAVIAQVNQNMVDGFNTINTNMANGFTALNAADAAEKEARIGADKKLAEAVNSGLSLNDQNVLQKNTTTIDADGNVTTSKTDANEMILNKGNDNQITMNENGIMVGTNSTVMDKDGVYTGGDTYSEAKAALKSDGSIKGADGKFTVNSANGTVNVNDQIELNGATGVVKSNGLNVGDGNMTVSSNGNIKSAGTLSVADGNFKVNSNGGVSAAGGKTTLASDGSIKAADGKFTVNSNGGVKAADGKITLSSDGSVKAADGKFTVNSNGAVKAADGKFTVDSNGAVSAANGNTTIDSNGNLSTKGTVSAANGKFSVDTNGKITSTGLDAGSGTIQTTGTVQAGDVKTGTLETTGDATIGGNLTVEKDLTVNGEFNAKTLSSKLDENNYTEIHGGNVTSKNLKYSDTGELQASSSKMDETGSTVWARDDESIGTSTITADSVKQSLSDTGDNPTNYASREIAQNGKNKYEMTDSVVEGSQSNVTKTTADTTDSQITLKDDNGNVLNKSYITQNLKKILQGVEEGDSKTTIEQDANNITNTAANGTITNDADKILNKGATSITSQIGDGSAVKTVMDANGIANTAIGGTISNEAKDIVNTASGDITNTAKNGTITNDAKDIVNKASGNMTTTVGGDQQNTVSGNKVETVKGSVTEKYGSQATTIDGNQSTNIGGSQSTVVAGDQTNTVSGNKTESVKGSVNENYGSLTTNVKNDSRLTAENINNTARNKITNRALDVETDASSSIVNRVSNDYGTNTSTQTSSETQEEMSQADGKKASYIRGAAEEKSQLVNGNTKTTIDTIAGQTNTNITDGTNTSNDLQKADQIASSVTDGTNTTVVNQNAKSIASSITDGTKSNSSSNTVDQSAQVIKASDTQYSASTKTATRSEEALKNGSTILDIVKDSSTGTISAAVTDGTNLTGSTMTAKSITNSAAESIVNEIGDGSKVKSKMTAGGITNTAKDGTITNDAKDVLNKGTNSVINEVGKNQVAVKTDSVKAAYGSDTSTTWDAKGITNTTSGDISNTASGSMTNTIGKDLTTTVGGNQKTTVTGDSELTAENVKAIGKKSITSQIGEGENAAVKTVMKADGIANTATGGTISNTADKIANTATTSITDKVGDKVSRTMSTSSIEDKVGTTTVTTTDGLTKLTNEAGNHKTQMDYAEVLKDLGVRGSATVNGTSDLKGDVIMESNATVKKDLTVEGATTTKTLKVTETSEFDGAATFNDIVNMNKGLTVKGGVTADTVTADSYKVGDKTYIDANGINANNQKITNVAAGDISEGSTDAVNGGQLHATNTRVANVENRVTQVETRVDKLDNKIDKVGANAAAMANLHPLEFDADSKWNIAAAVGNSGSETASAVGVFYRPNENVMVNASASMGTGENMFGGGVSVRLGHGGNKAKEAQMKAAAAENKELRAQVNELTARMDALLSVLNPNMSKEFPDVPANHWAYEAVSRLAGNGLVEGYEDGKYHGERQMTRYEMAEIIYNALSKGAKAEKKLVEEFRPELQAMAAQKKA